MTNICQKCETQNRSGAKFCRGCGQPLSKPVRTPRPPSIPGSRPIARRRYLWWLLGAGLLLTFLLLVTGVGLVWYGILEGVSASSITSPAEVATGSNTATPTSPTVEAAGEEETPSPSPSPSPLPTSGPLIIPGTDIQIPHLSEEEEIEIGQEVAAEIEAEYGLYENVDDMQRVGAIGQQIVSLSDRPHLVYHFKLLDTEEINAFAAPGGFIYVSRGMLEFVQSDDELAGVIGHEIAHVAQRHGAEKIEAIALSRAAAEVVLSEQPDLADIYETQAGQIGLQMSALLLHNGWSHHQEYEADEYGTIYMAQAGYNPEAVLDLFRRMQTRFEPDEPGMAEQLLSTHPPFQKRIDWVEETITTNGL